MWTSFSKTKLHFGFGIFSTAAELSKELMNGHVLVVTGQSALKTGTLKKLEDQLKQCEITVSTMSHISKDPSINDVEKIVNYCREHNVKTLIALGGGSSIDAVKAAAVISPLTCSVQYALDNSVSYVEKLNVIAIPTTAGTGAELSRGAIITDEKGGVKTGVRGDLISPEMAIIDPELTFTVPQKQISITGFDIFTHAVETYISKKATPVTEMYSLKAISEVVAYLPKALDDNLDINARSSLAFHSAMMGYNLANSSTCLPHRLQYPLGVQTKTEHALGLAALYRSWVEKTAEASSKKFAIISKLMSQSLEIMDEGILNSLTEFLKKIDLVITLSDLGVNEQDCEKLAEMVSGSLENDPWWEPSKNISEIYKNALRG